MADIVEIEEVNPEEVPADATFRWVIAPYDCHVSELGVISPQLYNPWYGDIVADYLMRAYANGQVAVPEKPDYRRIRIRIKHEYREYHIIRDNVWGLKKDDSSVSYFYAAAGMVYWESFALRADIRPKARLGVKRSGNAGDPELLKSAALEDITDELGFVCDAICSAIDFASPRRPKRMEFAYGDEPFSLEDDDWEIYELPCGRLRLVPGISKDAMPGALLAKRLPPILDGFIGFVTRRLLISRFSTADTLSADTSVWMRRLYEEISKTFSYAASKQE